MRGRWLASAVAAVAVAVAANVALAHPEGGGDGTAGDGAGAGDGAATGNGGPPPDASGRSLPDLVQIMPGRVGVATRRSATRGTRTLLTFASSVENHGTGPLIVRAARPPGSATMSAWQVVARSDGTRERVRDVGTLRFVRGGGHSHWHLLGFHRYELRTVGGASLRRDRKTGFCLGDRYDHTGSGRMPGEPSAAVYRRRCGLGQPSRSSLTQGISVGFGDIYPARVEGQFIDITGLRTGRYVLVQRLDPDGRLMQLHAHNDVASMLVKVVRGRRTRARILSWCNFTESCPTPGLHRR
jgi:hypothetical protein